LILLENNDLLSKNFLKVFFVKDFKSRCLYTIFYTVVPIIWFLILSYLESFELTYIDSLLKIAKETTPELIYGLTNDHIANVHITFDNIARFKMNVILTKTILLKFKYTLKSIILSFFV